MAEAPVARNVEVGSVLANLDVSRAWLVDPVTGRDGPGEIVVRDGILEAVTWLEGDEADGITPDGIIVAPGFIDLHTHLREPGNEDAETIASGLAAAGHGGFTVVCADGRIKVLRVKPADGPKGAAGEFAANAKLTPGTRLS